MTMLLDSRAVGQIRAGFALQRHAQIAPKLETARITLPAALEVAGWLEDATHNDALGREQLEALSARQPVLQNARAILRRGGAHDTRINVAEGIAELSTITELNNADRRWMGFLERFAAQLQASGYDQKYAQALSYSLHELGDNVVQHSFRKGDARPLSIAGWHVSGKTSAFVVLDLGQGIQKSLHANPQWKAVDSDDAALRSVVRNHATGRKGQTEGDGYRNVVKNFVSRNGFLCVRTGEAELLTHGTGFDLVVESSPVPFFRGTRVTAWCAPYQGSIPAEPAA